MGRRPGQTCSLCDRGVSLKDSRDDGNGGRRCKPDCEARKAADVKASPPTAKALAKADKEAVARLAAHRVAVLDFLRPKSAGTSFSPGEIARGSGVLLEEIDAVIKALLASGEIEEMADEEDEDPTYRAKPAEPKPPAEKKPRVNRRGKPTVESEAARTCRVCECSVEKPCADDAGICCVWTSSDTPAAGDLCTVCADAMVLADELLDEGMAPADVAKRVEEDSAPCVDAARTAKILERVIAARTPSKKDRPRTAKKPAPEAPAQATLPHSEEARTLTLPMGREPLAVVPADRGACEACGVKLTLENSSKLPSGRVVHVGCAAVAPSSDLRAPCTDCGAERGEPCAHATPEPASYIHDARLALLPAEDRAVSRRRAAEDRIRVALDDHARIPGDPPVPSRDGLVRALVVPGDFDAFTLRDVLGAMIERGEVCEHASDRVVGAMFLRRAPGSPPVVMGRVGVATKPGSGASEWAALAEMDRGAAPPAEETEIGDEYGEEVRDTEALEADDSGHAHTPTPPPAKPSRCTCDDFCEGECPAHPDDAQAAADRAEDEKQVQRDAAGHIACRAALTLTITPPSTHYAKADGSIVPAVAPIVDESSDLLAEHQAAACDRERALDVAAPADDSAKIEIDFTVSPVERIAVELQEIAQAVEGASGAVRVLMERATADRREREELSELCAEVESLRAEAALERSRARAAEADRTVLRAGINRAGDVLTRAALEGKIGEGLGAAELAAELERLAWASVEKEKAGGGALRGALRDVVGELGGELPESPTDEQLCVGAVIAASNALKAVSDLSGQVDTIAAERDTARSERDIAQGDARNMAGRVMALRAFIAPLAGLPAPHEATDHELIAAAAEGRIPVLVAVVEGAIAELTGASATSAKPLAEQLHEAVRATAQKLAVRRMRVPGATPETGNHTRPRDVF